MDHDYDEYEDEHDDVAVVVEPVSAGAQVTNGTAAVTNPEELRSNLHSICRDALDTKRPPKPASGVCSLLAGV